jgi:hypothetical protein
VAKMCEMSLGSSSGGLGILGLFLAAIINGLRQAYELVTPVQHQVSRRLDISYKIHTAPYPVYSMRCFSDMICR